MTDQVLMRDKEAAKLLGIGRTTLWNNVKKGEVPAPIKIGGATRWRVADLVAFVANAPTTMPSNKKEPQTPS